MKNIFCLALIFIFLSAKAQIEPQIAPVNPDYLEYLQNPGRFHGYIPPIKNLHLQPKFFSATKNLPSSYDLRTLGWVTSVKNQGNCGACWTFATCASIESFWLKSGLGAYNLSEDNINNCHGFDYPPCEGGNIYISFAYLARGGGVMLEADDPYMATPNPCPTNIYPVKYVTQGRYIPNDINAIKQAIYDYGALYTSYYHDDAYYNATSRTYYYNGSNPANHAVTLVGWDDNKVTAGGTGAWICKNSWGTSWGENGYFYISYNDSRINSEVGFFPGYYNYQTGDMIYTYAPFGNINDIGFNSNTGYGLAKFVANGNITIKAIGTFIASGGSYVSIEIYDQFNGTTLTGLIDTIGQKYCDYAGFRFFSLPNPISLSNNEDIYIKIKYLTPGYNYPIPVEQVYSGYASNVTLETGVNWVSSNGTTWQACGQGTSRQYDLTISLLASTAGPVITQWTSNKTFTCDGWIQFYDQSTNNPTNWLWDFGDGTFSTQQHPLHYYQINGTYTVKLKSWNSFGSDSLIRSNYITVNLPNPPSNVSGDTVCKGQQAILTANGNNLQWYNSLQGNPIAYGNTYITTPLLQSTTYYVSQKTLSPTYITGGDNRINSNGGFLNSSIAHYLVFNVYEPCLLYSVKVNAQTSGQRTFSLLNNLNQVVKDTTINLAAGIQEVVLNIPLQPGTRYKLRANSNCGLFRNNANCSYPYQIGSLISIDSSSATTNPTGYYYFFYDWKVYSYCESPRVPVQAIVRQSDITITPSGIQTLCWGDSMIIQLTGNAESVNWYPTGDTTQSITVNSPGTYYAIIDDGVCQVKTDSLILNMIAPPVAGFTFTIQGNTVQFTSTAQNFTGIKYDFGDGSYVYMANPYHNYQGPGPWNVVQYVWNSCDTATHSDTIYIPVLSFPEEKPIALIYPNPAFDHLFIISEEPLHSIKIFDFIGQEIKHYKFISTLNKINIDVSDLDPGTYLLYLNGKTKRYFIKTY
ncbi:MAG: lectin like domain-containing protein [Bacteroidales bacterium]|nr:lectin like domain-containing protein [Bacteroidales bacterium]